MSPPRRRLVVPKHQRVYWDACIFLAWITGERDYSREALDGLNETVRNVSRRLSTLIVSAIMANEVLPEAKPDDMRNTFDRLLTRPNVAVIDVERPIVKLSEEIRSYYKIRKDRGEASFVPSFADSLHLATAINREAEAFYTFDKGGKDKGNLIKLSGNVAGYPLIICSPPASQLTLDI